MLTKNLNSQPKASILAVALLIGIPASIGDLYVCDFIENNIRSGLYKYSAYFVFYLLLLYGFTKYLLFQMFGRQYDKSDKYGKIAIKICYVLILPGAAIMAVFNLFLHPVEGELNWGWMATWVIMVYSGIQTKSFCEIIESKKASP